MAQKITLKEAVETALEESIPAEQARLQKVQGGEAMVEGFAGFLPRLSASTSSSSTSLDSLGTGSWSSQVSLAQPVVDATAIVGLVSGFNQNTMYRKESVQTLSKLVVDVEKSYYNLAKSEALISSAEKAYERAQESERVVKKRYEVGDAGKADKLQAEAAALSAQMQLTLARGQLKDAKTHLSDLMMGKYEESSLEAEELTDPEKPDSLPTTVVSNELLKNNPDLTVLKLQTRSSSINVWQAWAALLPSLSITAGKTFTQDGAIPDLNQWNDVPTGYGVSISIPFIDIPSRAIGISRAHIAQKQARLAQASTELSTKELLSTLLYTQEVSYQSYEYAQKSEDLAQENYNITIKSYELGASSIVELMQAQADLADAERALAEAKANYWSSRADLNYVLGRSLEVR
jgi:outer membrane protein TolC